MVTKKFVENYSYQVKIRFANLLLKEAYQFYQKGETWRPFKYLDMPLEQNAVQWLETQKYVKKEEEFEVDRIVFSTYTITQEGINFLFCEEL